MSDLYTLSPRIARLDSACRSICKLRLAEKAAGARGVGPIAVAYDDRNGPNCECAREDEVDRAAFLDGAAAGNVVPMIRA
jgi:hypothetical protein